MKYPSGVEVKDLESIIKLMVAHGVTELAFGEIAIKRPLPPPPGRAESVESEFERLQRMSPDKQDRALMLQKTGGA